MLVDLASVCLEFKIAVFAVKLQIDYDDRLLFFSCTDARRRRKYFIESIISHFYKKIKGSRKFNIF